MKLDARHAPLRKIVSHGAFNSHILECGHELPESKDIYGEKGVMNHRRCSRCLHALPDSEKQAIEAKAIETRARNAQRKIAEERLSAYKYRNYIPLWCDAVVCSCGRSTIIEYYKWEAETLGHYFPRDIGWRWFVRKGEWTCGRPGHTQMKRRHLTVDTRVRHSTPPTKENITAYLKANKVAPDTISHLLLEWYQEIGVAAVNNQYSYEIGDEILWSTGIVPRPKKRTREEHYFTVA